MFQEEAICYTADSQSNHNSDIVEITSQIINRCQNRNPQCFVYLFLVVSREQVIDGAVYDEH